MVKNRGVIDIEISVSLRWKQALPATYGMSGLFIVDLLCEQFGNSRGMINDNDH